MIIQQSLFDGTNKVEKAIDALKTFEPPEGYYVAFSGGKVCLRKENRCQF